ncbi:MAG: tetratricopeptide repeat protein [Opitutales bacterium]
MKFDHPILLRLRASLLAFLFLLALGLATRPIESPSWKRVKSGQPELNLAGMESALGQGIILGMLGGFRAVMADFLWIQTNSVWESRDRAKLDTMVRLVTSIDPRPQFFWVNAARMIAYDVPHWRIREEGGYAKVPQQRQDEIDLEQAEQAFALIKRAQEFHPDNPQLYLEIGQIYMNRLEDPAKAAPWFLRASELPGAPFFAARIYAELLRRQGKDAEAYVFLTDLFRRLPDDNPYAQKGIILERIRVLEDTLSIPAEEQFEP